MNGNEAQLHNARRMTDDQLRREIHLVSRFAEQPPVRVRWLAVLRAELESRVNGNTP